MRKQGRQSPVHQSSGREDVTYLRTPRFKDRADKLADRFRRRCVALGRLHHGTLGVEPLTGHGKHAEQVRKQRGEGKPETFTFLGFTHYCGKRRSDGSFIVWRKTASKRIVANCAF